jgi:succinate dehydrogenase hydrophobic anchor subunit
MSDRQANQIDPPITGGPSERIGLLGWLSLYVSGAILFFLLLAHILVIHFFGDQKISAVSVRADVGAWSLALISLGLLLVGLLHGLIGFRRVSLDLELFGKKADRRFKLILSAVGTGLAVFGIIVFKSFYAL